MPTKQGGNRGARSRIMLGHLVQELNVGTVCSRTVSSDRSGLINICFREKALLLT